MAFSLVAPGDVGGQSLLLYIYPTYKFKIFNLCPMLYVRFDLHVRNGSFFILLLGCVDSRSLSLSTNTEKFPHRRYLGKLKLNTGSQKSKRLLAGLLLQGILTVILVPSTGLLPFRAKH